MHKKIQNKNSKIINELEKVHISVIARQIHLKFGIGDALYNTLFIQAWICLIPVKYTLVCCASTLAVLGCMTQILCPDLYLCTEIEIF